MSSNKNKIYPFYQIAKLLTIWSSIIFIPIVLVVSYILDLHLVYDVNHILLIVALLNILYALTSVLLLFVKKRRWRMIIKTHYQSEFVFLIFINVIALLGMVVLFDYLGGNRDYIANILVAVSAVVFVMLFYVGKHYFKMDFISRK